MKRRIARLVLLAGCTALAGPLTAVAQQPLRMSVTQQAPLTLTHQQRAAAVASVLSAYKANYVQPDKFSAIAERLNRDLASGALDAGDAVEFAQQVSNDLKAATDDQHAYVLYDQSSYNAAVAAQTGTDDGKALESYELARSERANSGVTELRILPGNIRYLKISAFMWIDDRTGEAYDDVMRFMSGGDALIIDLRGNGGGSQAAVNYLISHFLKPETLELTLTEAGKPPFQYHALEYLPAGRLTGKPLYVLIDGATGSAAEAAAYDVQEFKLGTLIGARTVGAANNNRFVPVAPSFMLSVPYGKPVHPVSGGNWEGVGVAPDIAIDPSQALDAAQSAALAALSTSNGKSPDVLADYAWARAPVEARLHPPVISAESLRALAGHYGAVTVEWRDGALWLQTPGKPFRRLAPLDTQGLFAIDGSEYLRVRFRVGALDLLWIDEPTARSYPRSR